MFSHIEQTLLTFVHTVPLEAFVFVASFIEEVIAPIPSPTVMVVSGSVAQVQELTVYALIPLALIGALGKTFGALVVYKISDKAEDFVMNRFGRFFGVSHADVEKLGSKLGNGFKDYILLTFFRALPFVPSVLVSVGSGLLKVPLPVFIVSTFLGTIVRDGFYLYAGFMGTEILSTFIATSTHMETYIEILAAVTVVAILIRLFYMRKQSRV